MTEHADPLRLFIDALPVRAQRLFPLDYRTIPAIRACHERGDDLAALAQKFSAGTERRSRSDTRALLLYRLLRHAGVLEDVDEPGDRT